MGINEPTLEQTLPVIMQRVRRIWDAALDNLPPTAEVMLEQLARQTYLTPLDERFLQAMEEEYEIK